MKRIIFSYLLLWVGSHLATAQKQYRVILKPAGESDYKLNPEPQLVDSSNLTAFINNIYTKLYKSGYLTAEIKKSKENMDSLWLEVDAGKTYKLQQLKKGNLPQEIQSKIDFRERKFKDREFNYQIISRKLEQILDFAENNGYPFASVTLDTVDVYAQKINAAINYQPGPYISFDSLKILGNVNTKVSFLQAYLRIFPGKSFENSKVEEAPERITKLPFLESTGNNFVTFQNNQAIYNISLVTKKVNLLDGIIGFLPNEQEDGKLLITGQLNLKLYDLFSAGKSIELNWKRLQVQSQSLDFQYDHPNLFNSPLSLSLGFNLLKEDSTFLNRNLKLDARFEPGKYSSYNVFVNDKASDVLNNENFNSPDPGAILDYNLTSYGVGLSWNNLNDIVDPTRGISMNVEAQFGNKHIRKNELLDADLMGDIPLNTVQYQVNVHWSNYLRIGNRWVFNTVIRGGKLFNQRLLLNDLYRLGGLNSLRGFNENYIFASSYVLTNLNLKFYFDELSHFLFFYDQGILDNSVTSFDDFDTPLGFGVGINFTTNTGIFSFIYALGKSIDQPLNFNYSKIHFGYSSKF